MNKILCKLTDQNMKTYNGFKWVLGKKEVIENSGGNLCSANFFHYYEHPLLAVLLNPIHADIKNPRLFKIEVGGELLHDRGLKSGAKEMTLIEEIELPKITNEQKVFFCILCAKSVYKDPEFNLWSDNWISGKDRTVYAANAAYAVYAAYAADYADYAAYAAANVAKAAYAADYAAYAANAAYAAANVDKAAANAIDLIAIAKQSLLIK
jgi:hypothetical protein